MDDATSDLGVFRAGLIGTVLFVVGLTLGSLFGCIDRDDLADVQVWEACADIGVVDAALQHAAASVCSDPSLSPETLERMRVEECPDHQMPKVVIANRITGVEELVFSSGMMVRFHPSDDFTASSTGSNPAADPNDPGDHQMTPGDDDQVWILDAGDHGEFAASVAAQTMGLEPAAYEVLFAGDDLADQLTQLDPAARVVLVQLPTESTASLDVGDDEGWAAHMVTPESEIVRALDAIHVADAVNKQSMILNMSFGAYSCGEVPEEAAAAMTRLARHGVRFVASAGNDERAEAPYPAAFAQSSESLLADQVTVVGSTAASGGRSCYSNFGTWVDVWFPGEKVLGERRTEAGDRQAGTWSGTSFSAPQAAAMLTSQSDDPMVPFAAVPTPPNESFDIEVQFVRAGVPDPQVIETTTWCDPDGDFRPRGGVKEN